MINPTDEPYEFIFEMVMSDKPELIPMHCNMLKGYVEGGTSTEVTYTFSPTAPGVSAFFNSTFYFEKEMNARWLYHPVFEMNLKSSHLSYRSTNLNGNS